MNDQENNENVWEIAIEDTPDIYFNEFGVGLNESDVLILLKKNGVNKVLLNSSYMTIKALGITLLQVVNDFEEKTGHEIPYFGTIKGSKEENDSNN
ncbi:MULTISPECIES: hypothetical protein [Spirulina sp. CCY15215]|uniref:hypothetical protein n=1 Tax=Spirulina sp. CCY15215 TaxID=2767591 RepID=UPI0019513C89|nr:hypothetical protein [Spirulina major]